MKLSLSRFAGILLLLTVFCGYTFGQTAIHIKNQSIIHEEIRNVFEYGIQLPSGSIVSYRVIAKIVTRDSIAVAQISNVFPNIEIASDMGGFILRFTNVNYPLRTANYPKKYLFESGMQLGVMTGRAENFVVQAHLIPAKLPFLIGQLDYTAGVYNTTEYKFFGEAVSIGIGINMYDKKGNSIHWITGYSEKHISRYYKLPDDDVFDLRNYKDTMKSTNFYLMAQYQVNRIFEPFFFTGGVKINFNTIEVDEKANKFQLLVGIGLRVL